MSFSIKRESASSIFKNTQKNTQNILAVVNGCLEPFEILSDCLLSHFDEFDCLGSSCFDYCRVNIGYWMWQTFKRALRNEWKWMIFEFAEHTLSITKHRGNFSIKSCANIVVIESRDSQERICTHMRINIDEWLCTNQIIIKVKLHGKFSPLPQGFGSAFGNVWPKTWGIRTNFAQRCSQNFCQPNYAQEKFI